MPPKSHCHPDRTIANTVREPPTAPPPGFERADNAFRVTPSTSVPNTHPGDRLDGKTPSLPTTHTRTDTHSTNERRLSARLLCSTNVQTSRRSTLNLKLYPPIPAPNSKGRLFLSNSQR